MTIRYLPILKLNKDTSFKTDKKINFYTNRRKSVQSVSSVCHFRIISPLSGQPL